jgi:glutathione synthase
MWPPDLTDNQLLDLKIAAMDWAAAHGLVVCHPDRESRTTVHAPISLFPTPYPKSCYDLAQKLQPHYNQLVDEVARDDEFLSSVMTRYKYRLGNHIAGILI